MKNKIPVSVLIEIENQVKISKETGIISYTSLSKLMHDNKVSCDILAKAIDLAIAMPQAEVDAAITEYDQTNPKMDELLFVKSLQTKYNATRGDVIQRIQHVRRIRKATSKK